MIECFFLLILCMIIVVSVLQNVVISVVRWFSENLVVLGCKIIRILYRFMMIVVQWWKLMFLFNSGIVRIVMINGVVNNIVQVCVRGSIENVQNVVKFVVDVISVCMIIQIGCLGCRLFFFVLLSRMSDISGKLKSDVKKMVWNVEKLVLFSYFMIILCVVKVFIVIRVKKVFFVFCVILYFVLVFVMLCVMFVLWLIIMVCKYYYSVIVG